MTEKADNPLKESLSALLDGEASEFELRRILKSGDETEAREIWQRYQIASALLRGDCHSPGEALNAPAFSAGVIAALNAEDLVHQDMANQDQAYREEDGQSQSPRTDNATPYTRDSGFSAILTNSWYSALGKVAIAASVTFAMLLGVSQFSLNEAGGVDANAVMAGVEASANHPGDTSANVPDGYSVPSLNAMTVSSVPGSPSRYNSTVRSLTLPASAAQNGTVQSGTVEYSPELQAQLQRILILHSEKATAEVGLTIVPISRLSSQDIPKE